MKFCKYFICIFLFLLANIVNAEQKSLKHSASAIYAYKTIVDEKTIQLIKYFNQLINNSTDETSIDNKNEAYYKAKKLFFPKRENNDQEVILSNFLLEVNIDKRSLLSSTDFLDALKAFSNTPNYQFEIDEKSTSEMAYNYIIKSYLIKSIILLNLIYTDDEGDEKVKLSRELDIKYETTSDLHFYIKSIETSSDKLPKGFTFVEPILDKESLPGANLIFKVKPASSRISIDGNYIDYLYGEKNPIDLGRHLVNISGEDDNYELLEPFEVWVKSDTDNIIVERNLVLKKGTLTIVPESECGFNANASIYKEVYYTKIKGIGKRKHEVQKSKWEEFTYRKLPFDLELEAGTYKFRISKLSYIPKPKHSEFTIYPNSHIDFGIRFVDIQSKIPPGDVRCSVCNIGNTKGNKCACCYGSGKCEMCKGTGKLTCRCCGGLGQFTLNSKDYKACSMCKGSGSIICTHCKGSTSCCACGGDGIW